MLEKKINYWLICFKSFNKRMLRHSLKLKNIYLQHSQMKKHKQTHLFSQKASAIFMMLALFWLTISTPFVCEFQQEMAKLKIENSPMTPNSSDEETSNPLGNSTEEKTVTNGSNFSEEYMHDHSSVHYIFIEIARFHKLMNSDIYIAFHGELLVPPPNQA